MAVRRCDECIEVAFVLAQRRPQGGDFFLLAIQRIQRYGHGLDSYVSKGGITRTGVHFNLEVQTGGRPIHIRQRRARGERAVADGEGQVSELVG
jgi:hypothetical protein